MTTTHDIHENQTTTTIWNVIFIEKYQRHNSMPFDELQSARKIVHENYQQQQPQNEANETNERKKKKNINK